MLLEEFDYNLDPDLIAQYPCAERDHSRMMTVDRSTDRIENHFFYEIVHFFKKGDVLVINDTRVIPARLYARKPTGSLLEVFLVKDRGDQGWEALIRPAKRVQSGMKIFFQGGSEAQIVDRVTDKKWLIHFRTETSFNEFLNRYGRPPLPPYIKRTAKDADQAEDLARYQTVYARKSGSIAAPTAGLHFSPGILASLADAGVHCVSVTLHVGLGTFLPIETDIVENHRMEEEYFEIGEEAAEKINSASRVITVGTTSTRTLETAADDRGRIHAGSGYTGLYIYPGYRFKRVQGLITNFHLPKSSLLLLVSAFAGRDLIRAAYEKATAERYRFYSYGDCMLIL